MFNKLYVFYIYLFYIYYYMINFCKNKFINIINNYHEYMNFNGDIGWVSKKGNFYGSIFFPLKAYKPI